ncbi:MAG: imidazole glycerol phosphate synthase subunit HisF [Deltaproteobacteria bacterium]|nr:imidazole glycerol phosphate synthase subunit HisF [Deltaproteobacteria bacterium]
MKRRVIPTLLLQEGRCVKGRQFKDYRNTGDPVTATRVYAAQNADELMFLDIDASQSGRAATVAVIERVSEEAFMPFTVGGGITTIQDVRALLNAGADKVAITTAAATSPDLIRAAAQAFGSQCIVAGIDVRREGDRWAVYTHAGRVRCDLELHDHVRHLEQLGAGEILINSIDHDGMMAGYDLELVRTVSSVTARPVIACGGAGNYGHLIDAFRAGAHAVACASLFHFGDNNPPRVRAYLKNAGFPVKTT